jgi:hypothetical protein
VSDITEEELLSLRRQLGKAREELRLIQEHASRYVSSIDIPLALIEEEQRLFDRIAELERQLPSEEIVAGGGRFGPRKANAARLSAFRGMLSEHISARLTESNHLRVQIPLPDLVAIDDFFTVVADRLKKVEFIYLVFAIVNSGDLGTVTGLMSFLADHPDEAVTPSYQLNRIIESTAIKPLQLTFAHYGSDASFDLLGVGKVLEVLRDMIKDLTWRGKHEKEMADLERQSKGAEISRMKAETDLVMTDMAARQLEILEKANNLKLPDDYKRRIISALLPQMRMIANPQPPGLPKSARPRGARSR